MSSEIQIYGKVKCVIRHFFCDMFAICIDTSEYKKQITICFVSNKKPYNSILQQDIGA